MQLDEQLRPYMVDSTEGLKKFFVYYFCFNWVLMIIMVVFLHIFLNIMSLFSKKWLNYFALKRHDKYLYVSYMVACFNSTTAILSSYHGLFFTCKGGNGPYNNIFNNNECMMDLDVSQKYGLTMIAAYFTYDFLYCLLVIRNNDKLMM